MSLVEIRALIWTSNILVGHSENISFSVSNMTMLLSDWKESLWEPSGDTFPVNEKGCQDFFENKWAEDRSILCWLCI